MILAADNMNILIAQLNPTIGDFDGNTKKILDTIQLGREKNADLILFPELAVCGYPPEDLLFEPAFIENSNQCLDTIIKATKNIAIVIGTPRQTKRRTEKQLFNSAAVIENEVLLGYQDKTLLPTYDVFDEKRYFEPADSSKIWTIKNKRIVITICEDIWQHGETLRYGTYTRDPIKDLVGQHPDLLLNLSASPYSYFKKIGREHVCAQVASTLKCPVVLCNQVGGNDSLIFDGYSLFIGGDGILRKRAKGFVEDNLLIDISEKYSPISCNHNYLEDLYQALVLGVRDYFQKQGFTKACLGLSGGIDSALVAVIATEALGSENVLGVAMPSRYSSEGSISDAIQLSKALEISYRKISIEGPFQSYLDLLTPEFGNLPSDTTEENIQARIRGMILMALSNKLGYIVLSTGNKSELAMGYSTLYGDLCGGLSVINDLTKTQVYELSRWINRSQEIIPWSTIEKPPSAELKLNQKDSDTLPDYAIIDTVLQEFVENHHSAKQIANAYSYPLSLVENLFNRIHRNEYKRRQSPPGLRVSEKSFSIGRRFPIVQKF